MTGIRTTALLRTIPWLLLAAAAPLAGASPRLEPYVDALPIPPVLDPAPAGDGLARVTVTARAAWHRFHRDLPPTRVWAYDGLVPGPTLQARVGVPLKVDWVNALPALPLLPRTGVAPLPGDCGPLPEGRGVVHLHGAELWEGNFMDAAHNSDGYPDAWNPPGGTQQAFYPNRQAATGLWYHDHALACTAPNVAAGLVGFYFLRDPAEDALGLPHGAQEIPLMVQARAFNADGSVAWPGQASSEEVYGDVSTVNGMVWPYLNVQARRYRLRLLNASTARVYALRWRSPEGAPGPAWTLVGSDQGLLERPVRLDGPGAAQRRLVLGPGERADAVVDFGPRPGAVWLLANDSQTDLPDREPPLEKVMQVRVGAAPKAGDPSRVPALLRPAQAWAEAALERNISFGGQPRPGGGERLLLNHLPWGYPVQERPVAGSVERWNLVNTTAEWHSFHIHSARFRLRERRLLQGLGADAAAVPPSLPPEPCEAGDKDTVLLPPASVTVVDLRFGRYPGRYVYHCHMLEHEDDDMMRPYDIVAAAPPAFPF